LARGKRNNDGNPTEALHRRGFATPGRRRQGAAKARRGSHHVNETRSVRLRILLGPELLLALPHDLLVVIVRARDARGLGDLQLLVDDLLEGFLRDAAADVVAVDEERRRAVDAELAELGHVALDTRLALGAVLVGLELLDVEPDLLRHLDEAVVAHARGVLTARLRVRPEALVPEHVLVLDELALHRRRAGGEVRTHHDLRVHHHVLVNHANLTVVLLHELFEDRTDPLAVRSTKVPGLDHGHERGVRTLDLTGLEIGGDVDGERRIRRRLVLLAHLRLLLLLLD